MVSLFRDELRKHIVKFIKRVEDIPDIIPDRFFWDKSWHFVEEMSADRIRMNDLFTYLHIALENRIQS